MIEDIFEKKRLYFQKKFGQARDPNNSYQRERTDSLVQAYDDLDAKVRVGASKRNKIKKATSELIGDEVSGLRSAVSLHQMLVSLEQKRNNIQTQFDRAKQTNNKELQEHLQKQTRMIHEHMAYISETMRYDNVRLDTQKSLEKVQARINDRAMAGMDISEALRRKESEYLQLLSTANTTLDVRQDILNEATKTSVFIEDAERNVMKHLDSQIELRTRQARLEESIAERKKQRQRQDEERRERSLSEFLDEREQIKEKLESSISVFNRPPDVGWTEFLGTKLAGVTLGFLSAQKAMELFQRGSKKLLEYGDLNADAAYTYGVSLSQANKGFAGYLSGMQDLTKFNTETSVIMAKMNLDAAEAEKLMPMLLAANSRALEAHRKNDFETLGTLRDGVLAYTRLTGASLEESAKIQGFLMTQRNMNAKQADEEMLGIAGRIKGLNNALVSSGFRGTLLNMNEFTQVVANAAENAESLNFQTQDYAKSLAKAAKQAMLLGNNERRRLEIAQRNIQKSEEKNAFKDQRKGEVLTQKLRASFAKEIAAGDDAAMLQRLRTEFNITDEQTARKIIGNLTTDQRGPLLEQRMAELLRDTEISKSTTGELMLEDIKKTDLYQRLFKRKEEGGVTKNEFLALMETQYGSMAMWGYDPNDKTDRDAFIASVVGAIAETQDEIRMQDKSAWSTWAKEIPDSEKIRKAQEDAIKSARQEAEEGPTTLQTLMSNFRYVTENPILALAGSAGLATSIIAGRKQIGKLLGKVTGKNALANTGKEITESVSENLAEKGLKSSLLGLAKRNKLVVAGMGLTAGLTALGGYSLFGGTSKDEKMPQGSDAEQDAQTQPPTQPQSQIQQQTQQDNIRVDQSIDGNTSELERNTKALEENNSILRNTSSNNQSLVAPAQGTDNISDEDKSTSSKAQQIAFNSAVDAALHYGGVGTSKLVGKLGEQGIIGATKRMGESITAKLGSKLAGAGLSTGLKVGARSVPVLGPLISGAITTAMTDGSVGRKLAAGIGDALGTAGGQLATGGFFGGVAGGAGGQFAGLELYDRFFDNSMQKSIPQTAAEVLRYSEDNHLPTLKQDVRMQETRMPALSAVQATGVFGRPDLSGNAEIVMKIRVDQFAQVVKQANTLNQTRESQFSGPKR